jgi:hypothetical protein
MSNANEPPAGGKRWGISVESTGPGDELDPSKLDEILSTAKLLLPHLVEVIAKAHGVSASGFSANIKRSNS